MENKGVPVRGLVREGTKHNGNTQEVPRERPHESGYGRQHLGSPSERSSESGDREPSPDIEKSGVSQK
ncbi:hypothetical protein PoB_006362800 [Plakobranchus ocellatus]|uniref:Uncharacterized protein n=1 Tax=Plakobranchus ocellatus TaxID=259542 RepID=A0AAV4CYW9_9GAST|nr:hypothetical protein PoB_006362800 [Plakobranchus ocellatus]